MLQIRGVTKAYHKQGRPILALRDLSLDVSQGEFIIILGPSGSGKSTLLLVLGGMLPPDSGRALYESSDIYGWTPSKRNRYRKETVGFVFQRYFLVPYLTVFDNIRMPLVIQGRGADRTEEIRRLARRLRIEDRLGHRPAELSVGEQQRAAVARAMMGGKKLILADEPTGNLDSRNAEIIAECLSEERGRGRTILLVTHDETLLDIGTRRLYLVSGCVTEDSGVEPAADPGGNND